MASINQAIIVGNIGKEPKIAETKDSKKRKIVSFSVATTERGFTKQDGTKIEDSTEWHNVVLFGNLAEIAAKYLHQGSLVYIQGKMKTRSYDDKNGQKRYITEIIGDVMQMLSKQEKQPENASQMPKSSNDTYSIYPESPIPPELQGKSLAEMFAAQNGTIADDVPF